MLTQQQIDAVYEQGKAAFKRDASAYGPHKPRPVSNNPYSCAAGDSPKLVEAWAKGYAQDVRRTQA